MKFIADDNNIYFRCVEDSNEAIMITDKAGALAYVNPAWLRAYGYRKEEVLGRTPRLLRSSQQSKDFYKKMWDQILDPTIGYWKGELTNQAKDGHEVPVLLSITPYKDPSGNNIGYMGIALDLTQRKSLEAHVAQQDRLATIGELTSGLAHEIGTPIGVIRGRAEMMQMEASPETSAHKNLNIIIRQIDRISGLISTLLKLSRDQGDIELKPVTISNVTSEVHELISYRLIQRKIEWQINLPENFTVSGDANRLEQIFLNLVLNAMYAITNKPLKTEHNYITISGEYKGPKAIIRVEDTGGGIPKEILRRIFDPFFTTKPTDQGTGLGLSIVSRLMHEMSGMIHVESNPPHGSTFILELQKSSKH